jgi:hypothetical protein
LIVIQFWVIHSRKKTADVIQIIIYSGVSYSLISKQMGKTMCQDQGKLEEIENKFSVTPSELKIKFITCSRNRSAVPFARYLVWLGGYRPHPLRTLQVVPGAGFLAKKQAVPGYLPK